MRKFIFNAGLKLSLECIEWVAKWLLHTNHLGTNADPSLFSTGVDNTILNE